MIHHTRSSASRWRLLEAALAYAEVEGLPVFPLEPRGKRPIVAHGFQAATCEPRKIRTWWEHVPLANIGIPTGQRSGLVVLDVDAPGPVHPQAQGSAALERLLTIAGERTLPPTRMARTGGGGLHLVFAAPAHSLIRSQVGLAGMVGLDVKGEGGYIIFPPSLHASGRFYRWINAERPAPYPNWLFALSGEVYRFPAALPPQSRTATPSRDDLERLAVSLAEHQARPGNRNALGFWLACRLVERRLSHTQAAHIMRVYARHVPAGAHPYTEQEALRTLASATRTTHTHLR